MVAGRVPAWIACAGDRGGGKRAIALGRVMDAAATDGFDITGQC